MLRVLLQATALVALILPPAITPTDGAHSFGLGVPAWADDGDGGDGGDGGSEGGDDGGDDGGDGGAAAGSSDGGQARINRRGDSALDEIVAARVTPAQLAALVRQGFAVTARRNSTLLPTITVKLRPPLRLTLDQAIAEVERLNPNSVADRNHHYRASADACDGPHCEARALIGWPLAKGGALACARPARLAIGLIDTRVQRDHPALAGRAIETISVRSDSRRPSSAAHGTAVAALLVGALDSAAPGLLPQARLVAIDAFYRGGLADERMDLFDLVTAIDELVRRKVRLINFSFAGPPNKLLERSVAAAAQRGVVMVAAVGNAGALAEPRYPAAYPGVIAVTAVDAQRNVYRRAVQGEHVTIAAPGVDVWVARADTAGGWEQSGTSYAAPFVTAAAALVLTRAPGTSPAAVRNALQRSARDLGAPGVDTVFGHGLVRTDGLCAGAARVR